MRVAFLPAGTKAQLDEGGERTVLADNTAAGAVMLQSVRYRCVEVCNWKRLLCSYITYTADHMYTHFQLAPEFSVT
jgi:hypothetical protein